MSCGAWYMYMWNMVDIKSATTENRRGKKKKRQRQNIMAALLGGHKNAAVASKLCSAAVVRGFTLKLGCGSELLHFS